MALRELKATRTRAVIIDVASRLFLERGFEGTTMEEIAEAAEVGTSTLYRYFPSKDLLLLAPFEGEGRLDEHLRARPADEPLAVALAHAIEDRLSTLVRSDDRLRAIRALIDASDGPRAKLWDLVESDRARLEAAIAERFDRPAGDVAVSMTARIAFLVVELAAEAWYSGDARPIPQIADSIMDEIASAGAVIPRRESSGS